MRGRSAVSGPRVTIGIPVYQGERYLDQAVHSIREQNYADLEILISDNGSTDGTEAICRRHAAEDPRVRYHRSEVNRGASWNFNRLVDLAEGELFKWAAHDDTLAATYVERCVQALDADPAAVVAHTGAVQIDEQGSVLHRWPPNPNAMAGPASRRFADMLFREGPCFPVFGLIRREVLEKTGLLGPYNAHDRPLLAELALHGRFVFVPDLLFYNREHPARSFRALRGARERIAWFDPNLAGRVVYRHPRLVLEYHRAILRSGVTGWDRVGAYLMLLRWTLLHSRRIAREVISGSLIHARRLLARLRGRNP
ncbi:MAG: glycosyltransferase family 2 protein [Nitriliruptor sp.]|nr:MAG: glycosyltransferase family 2 protein [Nitriliruptor sp.]